MDFLPLNSYRTRISLIFEERDGIHGIQNLARKGLEQKERTQLARDTECENLNHVTSIDLIG